MEKIMEEIIMPRRVRLNWSEIIAEQEASGKSIKAFCMKKRIHPNTFYKKRKEIRNNNFVEITIREEKGGEGPVILKYREYSVVLLPGFSKQTLRDLLSVTGVRQ